MSARLDAANLERCQHAMRVLAQTIRDGTCPAPLRVYRSKKDVYESVRHRLVSNSYYHVAEGEHASESPLSVTLRVWVREHTSDAARTATAAHDRAAKLAEAIADVKFQKIEGYFPTPPDVCHQLVALAAIQPDHTVLEPSAGTGELAVAIDTTKPASLKLIEIRPRFCEILRLRGYDANVVCGDFLDDTGFYDRIVMNPPFERMQDIDHVRWAYSRLKPNGRLVSVMSSGVFFNSCRKAEDFREWFATRGHSHELPSNAFASSGTGVNARIVILDKLPREVAAANEEAA